MKKTIVILFAAALTVSACHFLDTYPQDVKTVAESYNTVSDIEEALAGSHSSSSDSYM